MDRANVILDFVFEDGLLFVSLANIGDSPATDVRVEFEPRIRAADGRELGALPLFHRLRFLGPGRRIEVFVDSTAAYFARGEPVKVAAAIRWKDRGEEERSTAIRHDLEIYRDLPYVPGRPKR